MPDNKMQLIITGDASSAQNAMRSLGLETPAPGQTYTKAQYDAALKQRAELDKLLKSMGLKGTQDEIDGIGNAMLEWQRKIEHQLALVDIQEKNFMITPAEAVNKRLSLYQSGLDKYEEQYAVASQIKGKDQDRRDILIKIDQLQIKITDELQKQKEFSGTFAQGMSEGFQTFINELPSKYKQGIDLKTSNEEMVKAGEKFGFKIINIFGKMYGLMAEIATKMGYIDPSPYGKLLKKWEIYTPNVGTFGSYCRMMMVEKLGIEEKDGRSLLVDWTGFLIGGVKGEGENAMDMALEEHTV